LGLHLDVVIDDTPQGNDQGLMPGCHGRITRSRLLHSPRCLTFGSRRPNSSGQYRQGVAQARLNLVWFGISLAVKKTDKNTNSGTIQQR